MPPKTLIARGLSAAALACAALAFAAVFAPFPVQPKAPAPQPSGASPAATPVASPAASATATSTAAPTARPTGTGPVGTLPAASGWRELVAQERWTAAREAASNRIIEAPEDHDAWDGLALSEYRLGHWSEAASAYAESWTRGHRNADSARFAGNAALNSGDTAAAKQWYGRALEVRPGDPDVRYNLAVVLHRENDAKGAGEILEQIRKDSPGYARMANVLHNLAVAHIALGERAKAYASLAAGAALAPSDADIATRVMALRVTATADETDATWRDRLTALVALKPAGRVLANYQRDLGATHGRLGEFRQAAEAYRAVMAVLPDDSNSAAEWVLATVRVDDEAAVELARILAGRHAASARFHYALGMAEMARYATAEARREFELATRQDPSIEGAWVEMAKVHLRNGDNRSAQAVFGKAREAKVTGAQIRLLGAIVLSRIPERAAEAQAQFEAFERENAALPVGHRVDREQFLIACNERLVAPEVTAEVDGLVAAAREQSATDRNAAIATLLKAAALDARRSDVQMLLGDTYRMRGLTGEFVCADCMQKARDAYTAAIQTGDRAVHAAAYASMSYCEYRMVQLAFAIRDAKRAHWYNPGDQRVLTMLGDFSRANGDAAAAAGWYAKSEALGETVGAKLGLAHLKADEGENAAAEELLKWILAKEPNNLIARHRLGAVITSSGDNARIDEALAIFKKIVEERPDFRDAYFEMAKLYTRKGDEAKANEVRDVFNKLEADRNERAKLPIEH